METNSIVKVPVVQRQDYTMYLENFDNVLWFHTDVRNWSSNTKKQYMTDLDVLQHLSNCYFYALSEVANEKLIKFGKSIGFQHFKDLDISGKPYTIYFRSI
jgi:hypothetical protein